ncbi:MAG TPA: hypothetical protein VHB77_09525, partial [Planctomycetaceae bacterium]|nr:hypothetical protein [Planctomycetaceae bacterium]
NEGHPTRFQVNQRDLLDVPGAAFCYWLPESIVHAFALGPWLKGQVKQGLATTSNQQFLRYEWELPPHTEGWVPCARGGTYRKWCGLDFVRVDWRSGGAAIKALIPEKYPYLASWEWVAKNAGWYFRPGLTYSYMCYGSLSGRVMRNAVFEVASIGVFPVPDDERLVLAVLNCRTTSWILRAISQKHMFQAGMTENLPLPRIAPSERERLEGLVDACLDAKRQLVALDPCEGAFDADACEGRLIRDLLDGPEASILEEFALSARLHTAEGELEQIVVAGYGLCEADVANLLAETGVPAGWRPRVETTQSEHSSESLRDAARQLFEVGPNNLPRRADSERCGTPLPTETWLEAICDRMEIHPESALELLHRGIAVEHWRSPAEAQHRIAQGLSVLILRLLGRTWPGESARDGCADIVPLTAGTGRSTLTLLVVNRILELAHGCGRTVSAEECRERLQTALGQRLEDWLSKEFFRQHIRTFKRRPCVWQIQSQRRAPAFACLVSLRAVDRRLCDRIAELADNVLAETRSADRRRELERFLKNLESVRQNGFATEALAGIAEAEPLDAWCAARQGEAAPASAAGLVEQESAYDPDPCDGVRSNIAPFQKWGLLADPVLTANDVEAAINLRATRRADERRWSRQGHLPMPSAWWTARPD